MSGYGFDDLITLVGFAIEGKIEAQEQNFLFLYYIISHASSRDETSTIWFCSLSCRYMRSVTGFHSAIDPG